ncbi:hypothetical protein Acr_15g0019370 [Actinidia rufa]|uniref:Transmembrane protein n=1 Tax=Actinidia rufa TaxID=165716 RepID=A0A7J0FXA5_9ERIC|nr:hypothetical protein Acr_15g0019370 [Actinidia rufa]
MDENEKQKLQTTSQSKKYHRLLKKTLQFLVSVSVLSFLFSYSSSISHFLYDYNFHFSKWVYPLLNRTLERKYIFLICHGIVAFYCQKLQLNQPPSPNSHFTNEFAKGDEDGVKTVTAMESVIESLENVSDFEEEEEEEEERNGSSNIQVQEQQSPALVMETEDEREASGLLEAITGTEHDEEKEEEDASGSLIPPSAAAEENEVNVSTEELNRKFDEFIRKMKEEIRIGAQAAQQHLIIIV